MKNFDQADAILDNFLSTCATAGPLFVGIDPGADGAIAFLCGAANAVIDVPVITMSRGGKKTTKGKSRTKTEPNCPAICALFETIPPPFTIIIGLEEAQVMLKGKGNSAYNGYRVASHYWIYPLYFASKGYSWEKWHPSVWKKAMGLSGKDKEAARQKALQLWPLADIRLKEHHNRAEALLIAEYTRRIRGLSHFEPYGVA